MKIAVAQINTTVGDLNGNSLKIVEFCNKARELKADIAPLMNSTVRLLIDELGVVESGFQLEDVFTFLKQAMRNLPKFIQAMEMMENLFELWDCMEPMMKSAVPS